MTTKNRIDVTVRPGMSDREAVIAFVAYVNDPPDADIFDDGNWYGTPEDGRWYPDFQWAPGGHDNFRDFIETIEQATGKTPMARKMHAEDWEPFMAVASNFRMDEFDECEGGCCEGPGYNRENFRVTRRYPDRCGVRVHHSSSDHTDR